MPHAQGSAPLARRALLLGLLALGLAGCSSDYRKLSAGGSVPEVLIHDVLGQDRSPSYYYTLVRESHDEQDFCYRCGDDTFLVDKNIDALQRMGDASYARLEGQAQVIELLTEVLSEDRSALARSAAATSLTKIGARLPPYRGRPVDDDDGRQRNRLTEELHRLYGGDGGQRSNDPAVRRRIVAVITRLGDLRYPDLLMTKNAVRLFYARDYLIDETDPQIRQALDAAMVKRFRALVRVALEAGVEDPVAQVRADSLRGLKTLGDAEALETVTGRLAYESDWYVRMEAVEYLARVGDERAVAALLPLLEDANASVRHKARQGLVRIAGQDLGFRRRTWEHWARSRYPGIELGGETAEEEPAAGDGSGFPIGLR